MKLIINDFDKLTVEEQEEIQDAISGYTPNFYIVDLSECDACGKKEYLHKVETDGGIIRLCQNCILKK